MKKFLVAVLIILSCSLPVFARSDAQLTDEADIRINGQPAPSSLTDGYYTTKINTADTDVMTVETEAEMHSLYIIFDQPVTLSAPRGY